MSTMATRRKGAAHDRLLNAATILFYEDGITATGIDAIVKKAGVAKKSLYNNFSCKGALIAEYLRVRHSEWLGFYGARVGKANTPVARVLSVFDAYTDHAQHVYERGFRGCGLLNAAAEFPLGDSRRDIVRAHKEEVEALLNKHLTEMMPDDPNRAAQFAHHLALLLDGAIVRAGLDGNSDCVVHARQLALSLLAAK